MTERLKPYASAHGERGYSFYCPGCKHRHVYRTERGTYPGMENAPCWTFNNDLNGPTFEPSLLTWTEKPVPRDGETEHDAFWRWHERVAAGEMVPTQRTRVCHLFLRGGVIEFLADCHHALAGMRVTLPEFPSYD